MASLRNSPAVSSLWSMQYKAQCCKLNPSETFITSQTVLRLEEMPSANGDTLIFLFCKVFIY